MDLTEAVRGRRSVRRYEPTSVPLDTLALLVEAGCWAPTASNMQAWRFVIVTDAERLRKLRMAAPGVMGDPPAVIVICEDSAEATERAGPDGVELSKMDAAMAAFAITLEAYSRQLGSCIVASFSARAVQLVLRLPAGVVPMLIVSVGCSAVTPKAPPRKTQEVVYFETYSG
jgi:nitroreductase